MKESLFTLIIHHLIGYKYYGVLTCRKATTEAVQCGGVWSTRKEAEAAMRSISATFTPVEVYTFRSRHRIEKHGSTFNYTDAHLEEDGTLIFDN